MGMLSARLLADSMINALREGLSISDSLVIYDTVFRRYVRERIKALSSASYILHMMMNKSLGEVLQSMSGTRVDVEDYDNHIDAILKAALRRPWSFIRRFSPLLMNYR
ncbi:hypothetical protein [Vulcanisaeta distributa]|uniref:hypothetical protein n=1 Tax=Vulcanisaeta distributa TaxID=164451 RepID=UPI000AC5C2DC|nr:hypothetical protein [Vulcanisaeta distributa]